MAPDAAERRRRWPDYAAVWRWHFYAGLFCLPFVCWLAITGSIYLFRADVERLLDRPYESLRYEGVRAGPTDEVAAAVRAVPGSAFSRYELPATPTGAAQVLVDKDGVLTRVYVHPRTLAAMSIEKNDHRLMEIVSNLHGNLLLGDTGSITIELAASWAIVMLVTGIYLWFPRDATGAAGVLYPRLGRGRRAFWRDLHAVTGIWISATALFMLLSGLPWSTAWGAYLTLARDLSPVTAGVPDWPIGGAAAVRSAPAGMAGMTAEDMAAMDIGTAGGSRARGSEAGMNAYRALDLVVPTARRLDVPRPVWIVPPERAGGDWLVSSQTQDRPRRVKYRVSPIDGHIVRKADFAGRNIVDQVVDVAVATHEGHLFGRLNQLMLLLTAIGLVLMAISSVVLWWRRRPDGLLGAPLPGSEPRFSGVVALSILALAILVPLFALSLLAVLLAEFLILRRFAAVRRWLGLRQPPRLTT